MRDGTGRRIDSSAKRKLDWQPTKCGRPFKDSIHPEAICGKRQFKTPMHDIICKDGHCSTPIQMLADEIATWDKLYQDGEQPDDPDFEQPPGLPKDEPGGFYCTKEDMAPEGMPRLGPGDVKVGDVVHLISGGPRMTVLRIDDRIEYTKTKPQQSKVVGQTITCIWFTASLEGSWLGPFHHDFDINLLDSEV